MSYTTVINDLTGLTHISAGDLYTAFGPQMTFNDWFQWYIRPIASGEPFANCMECYCVHIDIVKLLVAHYSNLTTTAYGEFVHFLHIYNII
jgi:hypothetical protein